MIHTIMFDIALVNLGLRPLRYFILSCLLVVGNAPDKKG